MKVMNRLERIFFSKEKKDNIFKDDRYNYMSQGFGGSKKKYKYIKSYGIILFCIDGDAPKFLLMQRRDNYEYMDILRGHWPHEMRLKELLRGLSSEERERLKSYAFEELWDDLWVKHGKGIHKESFEKSKRKYQSIKRDKFSQMLSSSDDEDIEPPWGFPKGRKNPKELERVCALREFQEETRLDPKQIFFCKNVSPIAEFYKGKDGKNYCTYYFLAETNNCNLVQYMETPQCIRKYSISEEAGDLKWMSYDQASKILVSRRSNMLKSIANIIKTDYKKISPLCVKDVKPSIEKTAWNAPET